MTLQRPTTADGNVLNRRLEHGAMDRTNLEIRRAFDRGRRLRLRRARERRCLLAIDRCLNHLEEIHAGGGAIYRRDGCRKVVDELVETVHEQPPGPVHEARNSYDLHSALLNWESRVLDALVPHRRELFPDLNLDGDDWPRRRRHRRRSQLASA
ncbi:MAG: hypothetical protein ACREN7_04320 [Candidatus Dormibacteria bacterium]